MKDIKVLGTGCTKCTKTYEAVQAYVDNAGMDAAVSKVEALKDIMAYGVMRTPAIVVDDEVVHSGSVPSDKQLKKILG